MVAPETPVVAPLEAPARVWLWLATATIGGALAMSLELVAFRLYAPYFGNSVYVWGVMISVVMAGLAGGYAIGGRLADRMAGDRLLYGAILLSAAYQLLVLLLLHWLMPRLAARGVVLGASLGTVLIFVVPMGALAAIGPMVIRLCSRSGHVGAAAGKVYGLSTVGSMAGIIATTFLLMPHIGTAGTLRTLCALSFALGLVGLPRFGRGVAAALPLLAAPWFTPGIGWDRNTLWSAESPYNLVLVSRDGDSTVLQLNTRLGYQTVRKDSGPWADSYHDYFALGPVLGVPDRALVLGMGAGASIAVTRVVAPTLPIDAVEIDPSVVDAASQWFGLDRADPQLHIHTDDARPWLLRSGERYGIVHVDLYQGGPYIPFYLATVEFFDQIRAHMDERGVLLMNVCDVSKHQLLLSPMLATLQRVFPSVLVARTEATNYMVMAFAQPRTLQQVRQTLGEVSTGGRLGEVARLAAASLDEARVPEGTAAFTDDLAPVEETTLMALRDH